MLTGSEKAVSVTICNVAVKIKTNAETPPKARTANRTGSAKPRIFGEFRVSQYTSPATKRPTVELNMRLPLETVSRVWQCGHSISSAYAITGATGTVFPQCRHIRMTIIHPENLFVKDRGIKRATSAYCLEAMLIDIQRFDFGFEGGCRHAELSCGAEWP